MIDVDDDILDFVIVPDSNPILRKKSEVVTAFDDGLNVLVRQMTAAMLAKSGIGLSAIQIGVPLRVILINLNNEITVMVNPVITRTLNRETIEWEGCLSIDKSKWRWVSRPAKCDVTWQDQNGETHSGSFSHMKARVIQHEMDHLEGILITDKPFVASPKF